jgi:putative addiction module component (TIGR02574 family)
MVRIIAVVTIAGNARDPPVHRMTRSKLLHEAMALPPEEREELAALLLDSLEAPAGISIDDAEEIERRAAAALSGEDPGVPWKRYARGSKVDPVLVGRFARARS